MATLSGINNPSSSSAFADVMKGGSNWYNIGADVDSDGWPTVTAFYLNMQDSLGQGLDVDPLYLGTTTFEFTGSATVAITGNASNLSYSYSSGTNKTTGTFTFVQGLNSNVTFLEFTSAYRDVGLTVPGITNLKIMLPNAPGSATSYSTSTLFTTHIVDAMSHFDVIRFQLISDNQRDWADRTTPAYSNQSVGRMVQPYYDHGGYEQEKNAGWAWEYKIALCNAAGCDLYISIPPMATNTYITNLVNLIKFGSDGVNAYTSTQGSPVYAPLDSGLNVYFEIGNELWNTGGAFYNDYANISALTADVITADGADADAINYDGLATTQTGGNYDNITTWRYRYIIYRTIYISNVFRTIWGDGAMPSTGTARVRPLYNWQYANQSSTASTALIWADKYYAKTDPASTYAGTTRQIRYFLWGGGGAAYYGSSTGNGLTDLMPDSVFGDDVQSNGYTEAPSGTAWDFTGSAGIGRYTNGSDGIPLPYSGSQLGYITDDGTITGTFTVPASHTSDWYAVSWKAHNELATTDETPKQKLKIYLDYGTLDEVEITSRTYSQNDGTNCPKSLSQMTTPWYAYNVFWVESPYYFSNSFQLTTGTTHTITFVGQTASDYTAFLGEVRVTSADAIFAGGMPSGGEAAGQPAGQNIRNIMENECLWCKTFGLVQVAYESGWSLGGDDGGSPIQMRAKYGDSRTGPVQELFMQYFDEAGGTVNVFGTYQQWPNWSDDYAEQGLLDISAYPIIEGIDAHAIAGTVTPTAGRLTPRVLTPAYFDIASDATANTGAIDGDGGWIALLIRIPTSGDYNIDVVTTSGAAQTDYVLLIDDVIVGTATDSLTLSITPTLAAGNYSLKLRSTLDELTIVSITIEGVSAPDVPTVSSLTATGGVATTTWSSVAGATGYVFRYGTVESDVDTRVDVGNVLTYDISGLTSGDTLYVSISAYNATGESLPSDTASAMILDYDVEGTLGYWEFTNIVADDATPAAMPPTAKIGDVSFGTLDVAAGFTTLPWNNSGYTNFPGRWLTSEANSASIAAAITANKYWEFTITPAEGVRVTLTELNFQGWAQFNNDYEAALQYSVNGSTFYTVTIDGTNDSEAGHTADLSGVSALSSLTSDTTVYFRIIIREPTAFGVIGIGRGTSGNDITVTGIVSQIVPQYYVFQAGGLTYIFSTAG